MAGKAKIAIHHLRALSRVPFEVFVIVMAFLDKNSERSAPAVGWRGFNCKRRPKKGHLR